jgi:hypothetical protein
MEGDSYSEEKHKKKNGNGESYPRNFLQSVRVRRSVRSNNEMDRVLLDYGFNFLLPFGVILWIVFLVITNI